MDEFSSNGDNALIVHEYASVFQRSLSRVKNYALLDMARHGGFAMRGWSEDQLTLRQVQPVPSGTLAPRATANYVGYTISHKCRDFYFAIQLGAGTGLAFWSAIGNLQLQISPKPDNLLTLSIDASNNLNVSCVTWGYTVASLVTIANGSASFSTSGQSSLGALNATSVPRAPTYKLSLAGSPFLTTHINNCVLSTNLYYGNEDYRSYILGYTNSTIVFTADSTDTGRVGNVFIGGQMFTAQDALAAADIIVAGAGTTSHPLTGANSLVTKVIGYTSKTAVTLGASNSQASLAATNVNVFVGSISVQPTYTLAVAAGSDVAAGSSPILTIRKTNNHIKIGYILGGGAFVDIRAFIQANEKIVWEGEVETFGGPFFPRLFSTAGNSTLKVLYAFIDDPFTNLRQTSMTMRKAFGTGDVNFSSLYGGDASHPSSAYLYHVLEEVSAVQNLTTETSYINNFGVSSPATGFSYTIPANQAFTELTPAGTLAAGTIILPSILNQGSRLEIFSTQTITALTVTPPSGFTVVGAAITTIAANTSLAFRLVGTSFVRTT
jgi:hypothetical protein